MTESGQKWSDLFSLDITHEIIMFLPAEELTRRSICDKQIWKRLLERDFKESNPCDHPEKRYKYLDMYTDAERYRGKFENLLKAGKGTGRLLIDDRLKKVKVKYRSRRDVISGIPISEKKFVEMVRGRYNIVSMEFRDDATCGKYLVVILI